MTATAPAPEATAGTTPAAAEPTPAPVDLSAYFTEAQIRQLLAGIRPNRVGRNRDGQSHLEAYDVRAHLNRCLGFGRWSGDVIDSWLIFEEIDGEKVWDANRKKNGKPAPGWDDQRRITVGYRVRYRLTVCAPDGTTLATYTEEATGDAPNQPGFKRADAHDFAIKTAESQALKRCAINLGDQFGLSLYAKGSLDPVVGGTHVHAETTPAPTTAASIDAGAPAVVPEVAPEHAGLVGGDEAPAGMDPTTGELPAPQPTQQPTQQPPAGTPAATAPARPDPAVVAAAVQRIKSGATVEDVDACIARLAELGLTEVTPDGEDYTLGELAEGRLDKIRDELRGKAPANAPANAPRAAVPAAQPAGDDLGVDRGTGPDPGDLCRGSARRRAVMAQLEREHAQDPDTIAGFFGRPREQVATKRLSDYLQALQRRQLARARAATPAA